MGTAGHDRAARAGTTAVAAVAAAVLMLVLVTWAASIGPDTVISGGRTDRDPASPITSPTATPTETFEDYREDLEQTHHGTAPAWLRALAILVEIVVVLALGVLLARFVVRLWRRWRQRERRRRQSPVPPVDFEVLDPMAEMVAVVSADARQQRALLEEGEPRNAIVACWRRFEVQAGRAGVVRRPWQTSSEYVLAVLDGAGADDHAVVRLAELFREARFSDHPITEQHRAEALDALEAIHRTLGALAGGPRRPR